MSASTSLRTYRPSGCEQSQQGSCGPEGITAAELTKKVLSEITSAVAQRVRNVITKGTVDSPTKAATKAAIDTVEKATKSVTDLFKKNKE
jgi:hypothetical protein